jgi:hypothetical protein
MKTNQMLLDLNEFRLQFKLSEKFFEILII